jgi:hypothetical protein
MQRSKSRANDAGALAFLVRMAHDPIALAEFVLHPEDVLREWAISEVEKDALRSRDPNKIDALFGDGS